MENEKDFAREDSHSLGHLNGNNPIYCGLYRARRVPRAYSTDFHEVPQFGLWSILLLRDADVCVKYTGVQAKDRLLQLKQTAEAEVLRLEVELRSAKAKLGAFQDSLAAFDGDAPEAVEISMLRRFQEKVKREQGNVSDIETAIIDAKGRVAGFDEVLKMFPKEGEDSELRAGTQMFDVREALRANGKPMTLTEILKAIGVEGDEKKRNSLRGSLAAYANRGRVFTKEEAPETFGLIQFPTASASTTGTCS